MNEIKLFDELIENGYFINNLSDGESLKISFTFSGLGNSFKGKRFVLITKDNEVIQKAYDIKKRQLG